MATNEKGTVEAIKRAILRRFPEAVVYKIHGGQYQEAGIPDLVACVNGRFVAIEAKFKRPGESPERARQKVTARQQYQLDRLQQAGAVVGVAISAEDAHRILDQIYKSKERKEKRNVTSDNKH